MREIVGAVVSVSVGLILAACSALFPGSLGEWRSVLWIAVLVLIVAVPIWFWLLWRAKGKDKVKLSLSGPHLFRNPRFKNENRWTMRIYNGGPAPARHVLVRLQSATPQPRYGRWTADYPYPVYPVGTIANDAAQTSNLQRQINPKSHEDYEIVTGSETEEGKLKTSLNTKGGGHNDIYIEPDERWRLHYEVTSENADQVHFSLEIFVESNEVKVSKVRGGRWDAILRLAKG
jgi:hypothetical protein